MPALYSGIKQTFSNLQRKNKLNYKNLSSFLLSTPVV